MRNRITKCRPRERRRRFGMSLMELIVVLAVSAIVFGSAVSSLAFAMRSYTASRDSLQTDLTLQRLSEQFRKDVHIARSIAADSPADVALRLTTADQELVDYKLVEQAVVRLQLAADGSTAGRERFAIPPDSSLSFRLVESPRGDLLQVELKIDLTISRNDSQPRDTRVTVAMLGLHSRYSASNEM